MQHPNQDNKETHAPGTAPEVEPEVMKDIDTPAASEGATVSEETDEETQQESPSPEDTPAEESPEKEAEDQTAEKETNTQPRGKFKRFFRSYWHHKRWTILLTLLLIAGVLLAIPTTRYPLLALGVRRSYVVTVLDSKTGTPVSGATVSLNGVIVQTDSEGVVHIRSKIGKQNVVITKQYYQTLTGHVFVGLGTHHNTITEQLLATGRQVPVSVTNSLTGAVIENAEIKVLDTEAKTDSKGMATIVLPTSASSYQATILASGYNNTSANITVADRVISSNTFHLVPSGKVYFLSNLSGSIDVVSTNLDGSARQTVLAGTGSEDPNNTQLSNTTDWNYLALISRREAGPTPKLYSINTATNQSTVIDGTGSSYQIVGWVGHKLVYEVTSASVSPWQNGQVLLRAYDADSGKAVTLDQSVAVGSGASDYAEQTFGYTAQLVQGAIIYAKSWDTSDPNLYNGQSDQIISIKPDGSDKQVLKNISLSPTSGYDAIDVVVYLPQVLYIAIQNNAGTTYYIYQNGTITQSNTITSQTFYTSYPTYYISPSGGHAAWSTVRDSENTVLVGDATGANGQSVVNLSKYNVYGWFSDSYILLSQNPNTLYIMPAGGGTVTKIASYF